MAKEKRRNVFCETLINNPFKNSILHHLDYEKGICGFVPMKAHRFFTPHGRWNEKAFKNSGEKIRKNWDILNSIAWAEEYIQKGGGEK